MLLLLTWHGVAALRPSARTARGGVLGVTVSIGRLPDTGGLQELCERCV